MNGHGALVKWYWQGKMEVLTRSIWIALGLYPGLRGEWLATNRLNNGTSQICLDGTNRFIWDLQHGIAIYGLPTLPINGTIIGGGFEHKNVCFDFLYKHLSEIFLILRTERDMIIHGRLPVKYRIFLSDFNETDFGEKKYSYKFSWKFSGGSRVNSCGQTDGKTWRS